MTNKLPILLSIPHGGTNKPAELDGHLCITEHDQFDDSDPFVIEIYDLQDKVQRVIKTDIARAYVDLNRREDDLPPKNPDGVIKSMTCYGKPIYIKGREPDQNLQKTLLDAYHKKYHDKVKEYVKDSNLKLALDCHSMAAVAPSISPDGNNSKRPKFCISNQNGKTAPNAMMEELGKCITKSFGLKKEDVQYNDTFKGGYLTQSYGNNPLPWIQVEMGRQMYLEKPWFDKETLKIEKSRLKDLNRMFENSLKMFFI